MYTFSDALPGIFIRLNGTATLTVCPGELVSLTCTHDIIAGEVTQWKTSGTVSCSVLVSHVVNSGSEQPCGQTPFTITMISDDTGPVVSSTIRTTATEALDGTVIECFAGSLSSSPRIGNTTVNVIGEYCLLLYSQYKL